MLFNREYDREAENIILAAEFRMAQVLWDQLRKKIIVQLRQKEEVFITTTKNVRIARSVGAGVGIVGGVMTLGGFILAPFTLGGSLVVSVVGAGIGAAGGLTSVGASIADKVIEKNELKEVNNLLTIHDQLCRVMEELIRLLDNEARRLAHDNPDLSNDALFFGLLRTGETLLRFGSVGARGASVAVQVANLGGIGALEGGIFAARIASGAVAGVAIVGGLLNVILLPISVIDLSVTVHSLATERNTRAIDELRTLIDKFENNRQFVEGLLNGNDNNNNDNDDDDNQ